MDVSYLNGLKSLVLSRVFYKFAGQVGLFSGMKISGLALKIVRFGASFLYILFF